MEVIEMEENYTQAVSLDLQKNIGFFDDYKSTIDFFNNYPFRTFGEGVCHIIHQKNKNANIRNANQFKDYILQKCNDMKIDASLIGGEGTLRRWYSLKGPDKTAQSREKLFILAFVLCLTTEEAKGLFHKVYMDRFIDVRNYKEAVYFYCIEKGHSFQRAESIIYTIQNKADRITGEKISTYHLNEKVTNFETDEELVDFICENWRNFQFNNSRALEMFEKLLEGTGNISGVRDLADEEYNAECDLLESLKLPKDMKKRADGEHNEFVYKIITGVYADAENPSKKFDAVFKKDSIIHKEIKENFPKITTFNKLSIRANTPEFKEDYDALRKFLILLKFYHFSRLYQKNSHQQSFPEEALVNEINDLLNDCNMPPLYVANPHDMLYLSCVHSAAPLDSFRNFICDVIYYNEEIDF